MKKIMILALAIFTFWGCEDQQETADAYGNFEARELLVSSEMGGKLLTFKVDEGQELKAGKLVAVTDTTQLILQKQMLLARIEAISNKTQDAQPQIEVLQKQKDNLLREKRRIEALIEGNAATQKQLDDLHGQIEVIEQQIEATEAQTGTANKSIMAEVKPIYAQIRQIEDQIRRCYTYNPINGTVLVKLAEPTEMTAPGKPLYKISNTKKMTLRAYITGNQLGQVKLGQTVSVSVDENANENRTYNGKVTWVSEKAEFTPKIVQTKEERVNLVYAIKIEVPNDGTLKIGMPAEVNFSEKNEKINQ